MTVENLIGPAVFVRATMRRHIATGHAPYVAFLLDGNPGVGKTVISDEIAMEVAGSPHAIEHVNGQSLDVDLVRRWRAGGVYGNLFSEWTVKRIDEIDKASVAAMAEMLTLLDYMPRRFAVLATTNEYAKLRALSNGRLESRFIRLRVDAPTLEETSDLIRRRFKVPAAAAREIVRAAVPEGMLETEGCNVRSAVNDALAFVAAKGVAA